MAIRAGLWMIFTAFLVCLSVPAYAVQTPGHTETVLQSDHEHSHDHLGHTHDHAGHSHGPSSSSVSASSNRGLMGTLVVYSLLIASSSLLGGWLPGHFKLSHTSFQLLISLVGGLLLGIGVFHLLSHSIHELGIREVDTVAIWMMAGMILMFFLLRAFHVHHHAPAEDVVPDPNLLPLPVLHDLTTQVIEEKHEPHAGCDHGHGHAHGAPKGRLGWAGLFFGLGVHTLLDGLALGAAMQADATHGVTWLVALGVLLGIVLHKPLDSLSITTLMMQAGRSSRARWTVNFIYASLCPVGATAFLLGVRTAGELSHTIVGCSLALSAGAFICIALADLLPEMEFHSHDRWRLSTALLLGIALAWGIRYLEPAHLHN